MVTFITRLMPCGDPENYAYGNVTRDTGSCERQGPPHRRTSPIPTLTLSAVNLISLCLGRVTQEEELCTALWAVTSRDGGVDFC